MTQSPLEAAHQVLVVLDSLGIKHAIVGSVASSLQGVPRATMDADLVVDLDSSHLARFIEGLGQSYYVSEDAASEAIRTTGMFNLIHLGSGYKIDIHLAGEDPYEQTKLARARLISLASGESLRVATAEDLILSKLRWYRLGGGVSQRQWKDVLGILVFQPELDRAYLRRWSENLGISDLLLRALEESGR